MVTTGAAPAGAVGTAGVDAGPEADMVAAAVGAVGTTIAAMTTGGTTVVATGMGAGTAGRVAGFR